jgi:hypothetical protein
MAKYRPRPARVYGVQMPTEPSETSAFLGKAGRTPEPTDLIFPKWQRELFKTILEEQKLRFDREGRPRTAYSLRHTYMLAPDGGCRHLPNRQELPH